MTTVTLPRATGPAGPMGPMGPGATDAQVQTVITPIVNTAIDASEAALAAPGGSALVGFLQAGTGAVARTEQSKLRDVVSVKDFGAVGDNVADDTSAINLALAYGGTIRFPRGTYKISNRLLVTVDNTAIVLEAGTTVQGNVWTYPGGQFPFGALFLITGKRCSVTGAGMGQSFINVTGTSQANGIQFLRTEGGYAGFLTLDGGKADKTAITDDTFQTGLSVIKDIDADPTLANVLIEGVEFRNWVQYGTQAYGPYAKTTWKDCWSHDNGKAADAESVGAGIALTRGLRGIRVQNCLIENNKAWGVLASSAGLNSSDILVEGSTIRNNGQHGFAWTEESNLASVDGVGVDGLTLKNNTITGNAAGGVRLGCFDFGFIRNVTSENFVADNGGVGGVIIQSYGSVGNRVSNVTINDRSTENAGRGLFMDGFLDQSVRWNPQRISDNVGANVFNNGQSGLTFGAAGVGTPIASAENITIPADGNIFVLTGSTTVNSMNVENGRSFYLKFAGNITITIVGNVDMAADFVGKAGDVLHLISEGGVCSEAGRGVN